MALTEIDFSASYEGSSGVSQSPVWECLLKPPKLTSHMLSSSAYTRSVPKEYTAKEEEKHG